MVGGTASHNAAMDFATADLCDRFPEAAVVATPMMDVGGRAAFSGPIRTVRCFEDNTKVRAALEEPGAGAVLVVDGGGSMQCALVGDQLGALGIANGWVGVIVHGCVRDSADLQNMHLGIRALATHPRRSDKRGRGERDVVVSFGAVDFVPGHWLYADADGIVVLASPTDEETRCE